MSRGTRSNTGVAVVGVGMTRHGFFPELGWRDLIVASAYDAIADAGIAPTDIDGGMVSVTVPDSFEQQNLGALTADELGLAPAGFSQVVAACAAGIVGIQAGVNMIASGRHRCVLVAGVEKLSDTIAIAETNNHYMDADVESPAGFDSIDTMALIHARYMQKYEATLEGIAQFAVQDRWYARRNPRAADYRRPELTVEEVLDSGVVSHPITRLACGKACDGSSAVILMGLDDARALVGDRAIPIAGIAQATGPNAVATKFGFPGYGGADIAEAIPTAIAAEKAYAQAAVAPADVQLAQVHDCFTVMGSLHLEGLGIFPVGQAWSAVAGGATALDGRCPTNTDGGRIGLGHPTGTTGINIVVETTTQMRGEAGDRQVPRADVGVCQAMGGTNATSGVVVLAR